MIISVFSYGCLGLLIIKIDSEIRTTFKHLKTDKKAILLEISPS